jgi:adenine-specific DNA methylase
MLGSNNFAFQWHFGETNMSVGSYSYQSTLDVVLDNYEQLVAYFDSLEEKGEVTARRGDASDLPLDDDSVEAVVIDPPYGDNVMYAELSDAFYVWLREYLQSEFPDEFSSPTTNKQDEAVENTSTKTIDCGETEKLLDGGVTKVMSDATVFLRPLLHLLWVPRCPQLNVSNREQSLFFYDSGRVSR